MIEIENEYIMWGRKEVFAQIGAGLLAESAGGPAAADRRSDVPILREDRP